jgi:hypothetical protein
MDARRVVRIAVAALWLVVPAGSIGAVKVDFDAFADGTTITTQYPGVTFGLLPGSAVTGNHAVVRTPPVGEAQSPPNVATIGLCTGLEFCTPSVVGAFSEPQSLVSVDVGFLGPSAICPGDINPTATSCAEVRLYAYDAAGAEIARSPAVYLRSGGGVHAPLVVSTPGATIAGFQVRARDGTDTNKLVAIDDLAFSATAPPTPDFTLSTAPALATIDQGADADVGIAIGRLGGSAGPVALTVGGLPAGVHASLDPNPATGARATLHLTADADAPPTPTPVVVDVTGTPSSPAVGPAIRSVAVQVQVTSACPQVATKAELIARIRAGFRCIYIADAATIDMAAGELSGPDANDPALHGTELEAVLRVPDGVTLMGGRTAARDGGTLLLSAPVPGRTTLLELGRQARVTGLRLLGYSRSTADTGDRTTGVRIQSHGDGLPAADVRIDGNEIARWPNAAVELRDAGTTRSEVGSIRIDHDFLHHNVQCGAGYGVAIGSSGYATIEANTFSYNRHDVADDGDPTTGYTASGNLSLADGPTCNGFYNQHFDMHGTKRTGGAGHDGGEAGGFTEIRGNTVHGAQHYGFAGHLVRPAFELRGTPTIRAVFVDNVVAHESRSDALRIKGVPATYPYATLVTGGRLEVHGNRYGVDTSTALAVGDFDGDGHADVFQATGSLWAVSASGRRDWRVVNASTLTLERLGFGDFDGDGRTDVFSQSGDRWSVSSGASGPWQALPAGSSIPMRSYRFADLDGDHRTDVFRVGGGRFWYSRGGTTAWQPLATSSLPIAALRFGDFDGDGRTDVFSLAKGRWSVSDGGASPWRRLNSRLATGLDHLRFADVDGDGRTDVLRDAAGRWEVSLGGATAWRPLNAARQQPIWTMLLGDFDGDHRVDALQIGDLRRTAGTTTFGPLARWRLSRGAAAGQVVWARGTMR